MKELVKLFFLLVMSLNANAACTIDFISGSTEQAFSINEIQLNTTTVDLYDAAGTVSSSKTNTTTGVAFTECDAVSTGWVSDVTPTSPVTVIDNRNVYSLSGVGIPWLGYSVECSGVSGVEDLCALNGYQQWTEALELSSLAIKVHFYVIGDVVSGEYVLPASTALGHFKISEKRILGVYAGGSGTRIIARGRTCSIDNANLVVNLGHQSMGNVPKTGSIGNQASFSLNLSACNSVNAVFMTLESANQDPDFDNAAENGVIGLDQISGVASGVGVQIVNASSQMPIPLGVQTELWRYAQSQNISLPLMARYIRNNAPIKPGVANATASFTLVYE